MHGPYVLGTYVVHGFLFFFFRHPCQECVFSAGCSGACSLDWGCVGVVGVTSLTGLAMSIWMAGKGESMGKAGGWFLDLCGCVSCWVGWSFSGDGVCEDWTGEDEGEGAVGEWPAFALFRASRALESKWLATGLVYAGASPQYRWSYSGGGGGGPAGTPSTLSVSSSGIETGWLLERDRAELNEGRWDAAGVKVSGSEVADDPETSDEYDSSRWWPMWWFRLPSSLIEAAFWSNGR